MAEAEDRSEHQQRRQRAEERAGRMVLRRTRLAEEGADAARVEGVEAIALAWRLTRESWSLSRRPLPAYARVDTPYRFVRGGPT